MMQQHQMMGGPQMMVHNEVQQQQQQQRSNGDGTLSPTSNQLARWFSPELLAQASAGKLPSLDATQALSLEEFERNMHSSTTVNN
ncbi:eukaryotic translation initiation factor 4E transporter-like [Sitodiplosis mosellana]|uniref:eukaryotic translation initiation factor 4E transporter-like n=2 Tax=Sitodiplosis mosellana TaxID=263140 RepID=UPI002444E64F|nr:eukaryotic translation initiation factor 4E transporter-like [Sitodiplosis mosellana]